MKVSFYLLFFGICLLPFVSSYASVMDSLPYHQIPETPDEYTPAAVACRMIDGLGYRYYWATQDLKAADLNYKPSDDSRTIRETLDHIYGLSKTTLNAALNQPNIRPSDQDQLDFMELRAKTLQTIKKAADALRMDPDQDLSRSNIIFQRGERKSEFPFWNLLNGPLADAIYHTGQIVAFRRAAGNPLPAGVNVFIGKTKE